MPTGTLKNALNGAVPKDSQIKNPPLVSAVVEIQFPDIIKIKQPDEIAKFQDVLRKQYPETKQYATGVLNIDLVQGVRPQQRITQQFCDEQNNWMINLNENSIGLQTRNYTIRKEFVDRFQWIISCFIKQFEPGRTKRIGMRFVNQLKDDAYNDIKKYINNNLLGIWAEDNENIQHMLTETSMAAKEGQVIARWGMLPPNGTTDANLLPPQNSPSWIMDVDLSNSERMEFNTETVSKIVTALAERHYALFLWMTKEELRRPI